MAENAYNVYFALRKEIKGSMRLPAIVLAPTEDSWNDFNFRTRFDYVVFQTKQASTDNHGTILLAFVDSDESGVDFVRKKLSESRDGFFEASDIPQFFTIHRDMQAYRNLVLRVGISEASKVLVAMHDLVVMKRNRILPIWFDSAVKTEAFTKSLMREAETFFAFHNAVTILDGLEKESLSGISKELTLRFKLSAFRNEHRIKFNFEPESDLPKRIAIIIGKNGVGKSQSLSNIAKSLLSDDLMLRDGGSARPIINRLLAVSSPGEADSTFPKPKRRDKILYRRILLGRAKYRSNEPGLGDILLCLVRSKDVIQGRHRWRFFTEALSKIIPLDELFIETRDERSRSYFSSGVAFDRIMDGGEEQQLERWGKVAPHGSVWRQIHGQNEKLPLSSGQITFLRFAAQACLQIENGTLLLFDEPETHLHPNLISEFMRLLNKLLESTGSIAILATHSVYFVREVTRSQVTVLLESSPGFVNVTMPRLKTLGADVGAISSFVFGDSPFGDESFEYFLSDLSAKVKADPELLIRLKDELPAEAIMFLQRRIGGAV